MKKQNEIGFNNFKSFGEKIQTFSQKPITLIYGPNSVGKSSLLHFLLYAEYIKKSGELNLEKSDFAGDPIDLGGFSNFIHQKKTDAKIAYHLTFQKEPEIDQYFSSLYTIAKNFEKQGAFPDGIQVNDIEERMRTYRKKEKDTLIVFSNMVREYKRYKKQPDNLPSTFKKNHEADRKTNLSTFIIENLRILSKKEYQEKDEWAYDLLSAIASKIKNWPSKLIEIEKLMENCLESYEPLESILKRNDSQPFDGLDKLILFSIDYKEIEVDTLCIVTESEKIFKIYRLMARIKDIKKIKIEFEFSRSGKNKIGNYRYFLDDELIYTYDSKSKTICQNDDGDVLVLFKDSGLLYSYDDYPKAEKTLKNLGMIAFDIFLAENSMKTIDANFESFQITKGRFFERRYYELIGCSIHERIILKLKTDINNAGSQYFGPLRSYPKRSEMVEREFETTELRQTKSNAQNVLMMSKFDFYMITTAPKPLSKIWSLYVFILKSGGWKQLLSTPSVADSINLFRSNLNKISSDGSMSAKKIWSTFIKSANCQDKVNQWLSNDVMKLPYKIKIEKNKKYNKIGKFFKLKPKITNKLTFIDLRNNTKVGPREMGLGVSQFLPILVATQTLKNYKLFIEQPELHLHPAVQCEIADEFIRSMKIQGNEFIIESHSEHLLLRIMKRMRQTSEAEGTLDNEALALTPDDVCLIFVDNNGKMTYINELELDEDGSLLDPWPNGFFEEGFKERF